MRPITRGARVGAAIAAGALMLGTAAAGISSAGASKLPGASVSARPAFGKLPPTKGTKIKYGGTVTVGQTAGATPTYIFPIVPAANGSIYNAIMQYFLWRPLYWSPNGDSMPSVDYQDSVALQPIWKNHNRTLIIRLKNYRWSNGKPVTAQDVIFDYWMFKAAITLSPANEGNFTPGLYPQNVSSIRAANAKTVVINWKRTYNRDFLMFSQVGLLEPLPAAAWARTSASGPVLGANSGSSGFENIKNAEAIYTFLAGQSGDLATYASNPLWKTVDGPFKLTSYTPATGAFTVTKNFSYSGHKAYVHAVKFETFTTPAAQFNQLLTGKLDIGAVDQSDLPRVGSLKSHYAVWGEPNFGWQYVAYNFKDKTGKFNKIIGQLYIRQALAHLQNQPAEIRSRGIWDGAAYAAYGPVPGNPPSPLAPPSAKKNPYPFSIKTAGNILRSHGWAVRRGGLTRCVKPGKGAHECGAGITRGTPLSWNLIYATASPEIAAIDETWASNARQVGIRMRLSSKSFNFMISNYNDPAAPKNDNAWAMEDFGGFTGIIYPTTNEVFNTTGSFNLGGFSNPVVNKDISHSVFSTSNSAVKVEAGAVAHFQPGLFEPNPDLIFAIKKSITAKPQYFSNMSQYTFTPEYWYFKK